MMLLRLRCSRRTAMSTSQSSCPDGKRPTQRLHHSYSVFQVNTVQIACRGAPLDIGVNLRRERLKSRLQKPSPPARTDEKSRFLKPAWCATCCACAFLQVLFV